MNRSILSHFALFSAAAFAIAIIVSLLVSLWYGANDVMSSCSNLASLTTEHIQESFSGATYAEVFADDEALTYELIRTEMRGICSIVGAKYLYVFEFDAATQTRTYLLCVAAEENEDQMVRQERPFRSQAKATLSAQEQAAANGSTLDSAEFLKNKYGAIMTWYNPLRIAGSEKTFVMGVDFDARKELQDILEYALSFAIPLVMVITLIVTLELIALKRSVSNPLRALSSHMRSFVQNGAKSQEHAVVAKTAEIADIEASFNQMTEDIGNYVDHIEQMTKEHATATAELEVARRIQLGLVPPSTRCEGTGFEAYAFERTARAVGGDFYDLVELDDGRLLCVIADVSGKGVSAALFMAMFRTLLHDNLQRYPDPAQALNKANDIVVNNNPENMFVTLVAAVYDPATRKFTYANAGHTPLLVIGESYLSPEPGIALGLFEDADIVSETLTLEPGEGVLFYTDGAIEAVNANDEFFGEERLARTVYGSHDAQGAVEATVAAVDTFAGEREQFDDLTLLALFATDNGRTGWQATLEPNPSSFPNLREKILELCGKSPKVKQAVLACDEAFSNVASYAGATAVVVELRIAGTELVVRMADDGKPFDPLTYEPEELAFEDMDMGGMGIMFIRQASDDVAYEYVDGRNVLTMRFDL